MASRTLNARLAYSRVKSRRTRIALLLLVLLPVFFILDVATGPAQIPALDVVLALMGGGSSDARLIVWSIRLPVALAAVLVGFSLGVAGVLMQTVLDNPLASPYTLGIASGAAFGAALAYVAGLAAIPMLEAYTVTANAFIFAFVTALLVYALGRIRGFTAEALVLAGIAINYMFHSLLALMEYMASEEALQAIVFWLFGSLYKATWEKLAVLAASTIAALATAMPRAWRLTTLRIGDDAALALGVDPGRERVIAFAVASLATAVAVAFHGVIGFVGLVAPHIARLLVGEDQRYLIPSSGLLGSSVLLAADIIGKSVSPGAVIPIGIVTSMIGVPFFLALVAAKRGERYW